MTNRCLLALLCFAASTGNAQPTPKGALATVVHLYQRYAWEAAIGAPLLDGTLVTEPDSILRRYLDESLVRLIRRDRDCVDRTRGICNLDFLPMWDNQDPIGLTVRIVAGADSTKVVVALRTATQVDVNQLTYTLRNTPAGWRILDIAYTSHPSLVTLLQR